jgi:hypothetical protein
MKKSAFILLSIFIFNSCISENSNKKVIPEISPRDFQLIIKQVWLLNAHVQNNNKYSLVNKDSISQITLEILNAKGYNREDLIQTINYYSTKTVALDSLIKDLSDSLEKDKVEITIKLKEENSEKEGDSLINLLTIDNKDINNKLNKNLNFNKNKKDSLLKQLDRKSKNISKRRYNSKVKK